MQRLCNVIHCVVTFDAATVVDEILFLRDDILDSIGDYDFRKEVPIFQSESKVPKRKQATTYSFCQVDFVAREVDL